ncbi:DUF3519 domain-containing protein, partial [Helicobacter pylori]|nr:DUF3519 domain-containing protein [Helicobacter pylori]
MKLPKALNEATAGAALKYHIKRVLERSHSISEFSKNLELSAQNAKFSNNTLKIIEELTNGIKQASEELSKKASDLQHATTPLKEFGTNYPEFALKPKEALEKLLQEKNGQVAGAALKYHIKRVLERSHSISEFSKNLELSAQNAKFSNNTLKIIEELTNGIKQASEELSKKASDLQHATTPLKEFGTNYPEFALKPKEALEKLLQEKNGQVAGAAYREDLGGIDFVWGTPKTKDSVGYGLAHIIESREKQYKKLGLTPEQAKERTNELIKEIPNIIQKGLKEEDRPGYAAIILNNSKVILSKFKGDNELKNHYMITSFEVDEKVLRELETIAPLPNDYRDGGSISNLNRDNPTTKPLTDQEDLLKTSENLNETTQEVKNLSPLEQANAEKLAKLESEAKVSEQEFLKAKEQEKQRKEALKKKLEHERGNAGNIESQTKIEVGEDIPTQVQAQIPKSRV